MIPQSKTNMAEGGEEPTDNPFSFKKFVEQKGSDMEETASDESADDTGDMLDLPDVQSTGVRDADRSRRLPVGDEDKSKRKEENPFSFKKFLKTGNRSKGNNGSIATLDLANDLPDFVQDHFTPGSSQDWRQRNAASEVPLPDFALDSSSPKPTPKVNFETPMADLDDPMDPLVLPVHMQENAGARPKHNQSVHRPFGLPLDAVAGLPGNSHNNSEPEDDQDDVHSVPQANPTGGLPDFLSDSAVNSIDHRVNLDSPMAASDDFLFLHANGDYELELRRLREENRELRKQLNEAREFAETESKRVADVLKEMEAIEKREAEDTTALENMIQQVEANLITTTQRAQGAENTVNKLKQEVQTLQGQLQGCRRGHHGSRQTAGNDVMKEKAKYASEQISAAAKNAEQTLQQLLNGVENLKLVSSVLASIDKVSDVGADGNTDYTPDGACGGGAAT